MSKIDYAQVIKQMQDELDGLESRRRWLTASIASMRGLVEPTPNASETVSTAVPHVPSRSAIAPGLFSGMYATEAARKLRDLWPGAHRTPPEIADALIAGGVIHKSRADLLHSLHKVLLRENKRAAAKPAKAPIP